MVQAKGWMPSRDNVVTPIANNDRVGHGSQGHDEQPRRHSIRRTNPGDFYEPSSTGANRFNPGHREPASMNRSAPEGGPLVHVEPAETGDVTPAAALRSGARVAPGVPVRRTPAHPRRP